MKRQRKIAKGEVVKIKGANLGTKLIETFSFGGHSTTTWIGFCHFLTPPPPSFYTLSVDKNRIFLTPSPPHLVQVVIE